MQIDHVVDAKDAVEYLKQFAWVDDFDTVIERLLTTEKEEKDENL